MPRHPDPEVTRLRIIDVAEAMFLDDGIRATGMDAITARAGLAKTTIYRYFESKDDLVVAYLDRRDERHFEWLSVDGVPPQERLRVVVDRVQDAVTAVGFAGCPFLNAAAEFSDPASPVRRRVSRHKHAALQFFTELCAHVNASPLEEAAAGLMLLTDGAYEAGRVAGRNIPAACYRSNAFALLRHYGAAVD